MSIISIILFAASLSIDAFGIGISYRLRSIKIPIGAKLIICLISIIFTGISVAIGSMILLFLPPAIAKFIGAFMLMLLGAFIIFQAVSQKSKTKNLIQESNTIKEFVFSSIGIIIRIIKDPTLIDTDKSNHLDLMEATYLGIALSIDSFAAGISSSVSGVNSVMLPLTAGIFQLIFLSAGEYLGHHIQLVKNIKSNTFVVISGILLILLACLRFL